jgi:chromosome segregation ATPase
LVVLALLGLSFPLSARTLENAEAGAEERAERHTASVLLNEIPPELASGEIVGTEYRSLLELVQSEIMFDERVLRVRVFKPDGNLIFSTAPRDDIGEIVLPDDPQIEQAAGGTTVSVLVEPRGDADELFQTFVPLQVPDGQTAYAVAQIDQTYGSVQADANRIWLPVRIGLLAALVVILVRFGLSFRERHAPMPAGAARPTRDERKLRDAEERARAAERAAHQAEERLVEAERRLKEASTTQVPPDVLARVDELEMKLKAEVAEREQFAGEVQRARSALTGKEAELAHLREAAESTKAETTRSAELVAMANERAGEADKRAADAELRTADATQRVAASEARIAELETALRHAEERATRDEAKAGKAKRDDEAKAGADLLAAQLETNTLRLKLAEVESSLADANGRLAERARAGPDGGPAGAELDAARGELHAARAGLDVARAELDVAKADLARAGLELDSMRTELDEARSKASAPAAAADSNGEGAASKIAQLEARLAEMQAQRQDEITQLQRAHESLANTQAELMQSNRKLKDVQDRARELERAGGGAPAPGPAGPSRRSEPAPPVEDESEAEAFRRRIATMQDDMANPEPERKPAPEPMAPPAAEEESAEPLSLRERLARAAAARHRTGTPKG